MERMSIAKLRTSVETHLRGFNENSSLSLSCTILNPQSNEGTIFGAKSTVFIYGTNIFVASRTARNRREATVESLIAVHRHLVVNHDLILRQMREIEELASD